MCLYVVLLINKFHYWLSGIKNTADVVKNSFVVQDKLIYHEKYCFFVLERNKVFIKLSIDLYLACIFVYIFAS